MWENENGYHGYDFVDSDNYPMDLEGHGTHCAGVVAAEINNDLGIAGIAQINIMAVRILQRDGSSVADMISDGITYAADNGADVISMSFGCSVSAYSVRNACNYAWENGAILVASAGNDNSDWPHYPSSYSNVISVAATNQYNEKAFFSNYGSSVDIAAPGQDIYSTYIDGGYKFLSGTSMACPHVAGVAALLKSQNPSWTNQQIKQKMFDTADKIGFEGNYWKHGKVDASIDDGDTQVFPNVFVEIEKITNIGEGLDGIDADGNPEWFYEVIVEHEKKESVTNFNFKDNPNKVSGDYYSYYIEEYESEISSSNTWNVKNGIHTFECYSPIVTVKIKLMEDDFIFDWFSDIADISSRNNPGGDFEIGYDERGRVFNCKYDLTTHSLVESESDRYEEDGELFFTKGSWDGSTVMETVDWKQDDAQVFFKVSDDYNEPIVDAGGPYNARVGDTVTLDASVLGGFSPFQYFWDLDYDEVFEKQGKNVLFYCSESGEFKIKLKVIDSFGFSVFNETKIVVSENMAPDKPIISGPTQENFGEEYTYVVSSEDFDGDDVQYFVDWGDGSTSSWSEFVSSGESLEFNHSWDEKDTYYVKAKARDSFGKLSEWSELEVSMPKSKEITDSNLGYIQRLFNSFIDLLLKFLF